MSSRIRYHPLFDCDVREATGWYKRRSAKIGQAFLEAVREAVDEIIDNPGRFARSTSGCRYLRVRRFPYVVLFDVVDEDLLMLGVLHTARSIEKWRERREGI